MGGIVRANRIPISLNPVTCAPRIQVQSTLGLLERLVSPISPTSNHVRKQVPKRASNCPAWFRVDVFRDLEIMGRGSRSPPYAPLAGRQGLLSER